MIQISYVLTANDMVKAHTLHGGAFVKVSQALGVFLIAVGVAGLVVSPGTFPGSIITILLGLFFLLRVRLTAGLQYRRDLATAGEIRLTASDHGIEIHTARSTAQLNWEAFRRYAESSQVVRLYPQSNIFQVVPKRAIPANQSVEFRHLLTQHLGERTAANSRKLSPQVLVFLVVLVVVMVLLAMAIARRPG